MAIAILEDRDGYVLLSRGDERCVVVERRAGRYYSLHSRGRGSVPCDPDAVPAIVAEEDWTDEMRARATLRFAVRRHEELAQRLW
jgi:hypothetical protein